MMQLAQLAVNRQQLAAQVQVLARSFCPQVPLQMCDVSFVQFGQFDGTTTKVVVGNPGKRDHLQ